MGRFQSVNLSSRTDTTKLFSAFTIKVFLLVALFGATAVTHANYRCQYNNGVIVEATLCPRGTLTLGRSYGYQSEEAARQQRKADMWNSYREGSRAANEAAGRAIGNALFGAPSQQNPAVQAKLQQIKEIDALYKSGSISKAQADRLKAEILR